MRKRKMKKTPLSLENEGKLTLFFVGVGSAFSKRHYQTNLLVVKGTDHLMIDCGTKTPQAVYELGLSIIDIDTFFITHSHADHVGGLEEVMLMNRYVARKKPRIILPRPYQSLLWNNSLKGGSGCNESEGDRIKRLRMEDMWSVVRPSRAREYTRDTYHATVGSIDLKIFRTMHIPDQTTSWKTSCWSTGVVIDDRVMFSGDTRYDPELLLDFGSLFELEAIFHDCQFFTGGVHAGLDELDQLPDAVKAKMILIHYGDNWRQMTSRVSECGFKELGRQWVFYEFS